MTDRVISKSYMRKRSLLALFFLVLFASISVLGTLSGKNAERAFDKTLAAMDLAIVSLSDLSTAFGMLAQQPKAQESYLAHSKIRRASHAAETAMKALETALRTEDLTASSMRILNRSEQNPISDFRQVLHFGRLLGERRNSDNERTLTKIATLSLDTSNRLLAIYSDLRQQETEAFRANHAQQTLITLGSLGFFLLGAAIAVGLVYLPMERSVLAAHQQLQAERDRAEAASRSKTVFLASMSHEIRTPLNGIIGLSDSLIDDNLTRDQKATLELVNKSGHALLQVLNNILSTSRGEIVGADEDKEVFSLTGLCEDIVALFAIEGRNKGIEVRVLDAGLLPPLWVNSRSSQIRQVVTNLISNAVKFTHEGSVSLSLDARQVSGRYEVELTVTDTGIGIAAEDIAKIFSQFQQANEDIIRNYGGTGLGLSISRNIAEALGGTIDVTSEPGVGTQFLFRFPVEVADAPEGNSVEPFAAPIGGNLRILIVDDNKVNILVAERVLTRMGVEVQSASSAEDAFEAIRSWSPEIVLMDIRMPNMDGLEATRQIKQLERNREIAPLKIIGLSANHSREDIELGLNSGMCTYIPKPINAAKLVEAIRFATELNAA